MVVSTGVKTINCQRSTQSCWSRRWSDYPPPLLGKITLKIVKVGKELLFRYLQRLMLILNYSCAMKAAITPKTKLLFSSPCNPTGSVYSKEELKALPMYSPNILRFSFYQMKFMSNINFLDSHQSIAQFDFVKRSRRNREWCIQRICYDRMGDRLYRSTQIHCWCLW